MYPNNLYQLCKKEVGEGRGRCLGGGRVSQEGGMVTLAVGLITAAR